jgi:hypothetical protein
MQLPVADGGDDVPFLLAVLGVTIIEHYIYLHRMFEKFWDR